MGGKKSHVRNILVCELASDEFVGTRESFQSGQRKINVFIWQEKKG